MSLVRDIIERVVPEQDIIKWFAKPFVGTFLVFDIETSGRSFHVNRIVQNGCCLVSQGSCLLESAKSQYIKTEYSPSLWSAIYTDKSLGIQFLTECRKDGCDLDQIKRDIDANNGSIMGVDSVPKRLQEATAPNGRLYYQNAYDVTGISVKDCMEKGVDRSAAMTTYAKLLQICQDNGWPLVGHNIMRFDIPFVEHEIREYTDIKDFEIDRNKVIDTGMIVKAIQLNSKLGKKESISDFYKKIDNRRSRVKWTLDGYCIEAYKLDAKYGVDSSRQHSAEYDCWVNSCLMLELINAM